MFRFTIRDVLWLTVVVAASVAWWIEREARRDEHQNAMSWQLRAQAASLALEDANRQVWWDGDDAMGEKPAATGKGKVTIIYRDHRK